MTNRAHIEAVIMHAGGVLDGGPGAATVSRALSELVGDRFVVAQVRRDDGRFTLIIDAEWIELAESLVNSRQDLIEVDDLPQSVLLAVVAGWPDDWASTGPIEIDMTDDGLPRLRLGASRVQSA